MPARQLKPRTRLTPTTLGDWDRQSISDYWMVVAMNIEDGMQHCGLQAGVDYTAADLWKLAQPMVMKLWEEDKLELMWRPAPKFRDDD